NDLDIPALEALEDSLDEFPGAVVIVSHDREMMNRLCTEVIGLDGDPKVLEIGRAKAAKAGVTITLDHGMAFQLPYPDNSFDRVLSSLVLHHLTSENKQRALQQVHRVLRPGGELSVVDFGPPHSAYARLLSPLARRLEQAADNVNGLLPKMMRRAGFEQIEEPTHYTTLFGDLSLVRARKRD
ncbi:MAG: methyltransferase domain-containing protein, partial [Elusimicrobiota bacterium]